MDNNRIGVQGMNEEVNKKLNELEAIRLRNEELVKENEKLRKANSVNYDEYKEHLEALKEENEKLKNKLMHIESINGGLSDKIETIDDEYQEEIKGLKRELEKAKNEENIKLDHGMQLLQSENDEYIEALEKVRAENRKFKKEIEENNQVIENEYENKIFLAEQKAKETIDSLMLVNDKYMEKQKVMESDLVKYESTIKSLKETIKGLASLL